MAEPVPDPLLAPYRGERPPAPAWFDAAMARAPQRAWHRVEGAAIEALCWGERGRPGLLLLHGKMAHADWWCSIAPFFADSHRVVALSFAGMGGSQWREAYDIDTMVAEVVGVAEATGLFEAPVKPLLVGHSFGGFAGLRCAELHGARFAGLVTVDVPLLSREQRAARRRPSMREAFVARPTRVYASEAAALARFRFAPPQACDNHYLADQIARSSLRETPAEDGSRGWTWRFDPRVATTHPGRAAESLQGAACPVAITWGADSDLVDAGVAAYMGSLVPPGTPQIAIPAARHHVMVDQPLAFVSALRGLISAWPPRA